AIDARDDARWSVAGVFLEALARRDFDTMHTCLDPAIRFRALIAAGVLDLHGPNETVGQLRVWFGEHGLVEVVDASIGQLGPRVYLRWRIRRGRLGDPDSFQVVEQHAFATVGGRIESLDLLCSGFQAEQSPVS
ncbi:MAG: hypothetical protein QOI15_383, partial [Pseudonocardiales bacterium]|nr:hypothetical protein [Pseudonocardiales bacterium]